MLRLGTKVLIIVAGMLLFDSVLLLGYSQDDEAGIPTCSFTYFDPNCSPSGWIAFLLGDVVIGVSLGLMLHMLSKRSNTHIQKIAYLEEISRYNRLAFVVHSLKNDIGAILIIVGLTNMALRKAKTMDDIPAAIKTRQKDLGNIVNRASMTLNVGIPVLSPELADGLRKFLNKLEEVNMTNGISKGFPEYEYIRKNAKQLAQLLNTSLAETQESYKNAIKFMKVFRGTELY